MNPIVSHFPDLTAVQMSRLERLGSLYRYWNEQINVVSRKDIDQLYQHHVLHSLAIARFLSFKPGTRILDAGTGGGFPGIPLAIFFPESHFTLADSIAKKIKVVQAVASGTGLTNVRTICSRVEDLPESFDFIVSRAVTAFPTFVGWVEKLVEPGGFNDKANGILYLKGGNIEEEIRPFSGHLVIQEISDYFEETYFQSKKLIYLAVH